MRNTSSVKVNKIKYDKRQVKQSMICTIVFFSLTVGSNVIMFLNLLDGASDLIMLIFTFIYMCSGPAFFYSGYQLFSAVCYMKRLAKHGYEIPENKKDYEGLLANLPHQESFIPKESYSRSSLVMGILSIGCLVITTLLNVRYVLEWNFMYKEPIAFMVGLQSIFDCLLLVHGVLFFRQVNVGKYKDDVECDNTRKNRTSLPDGILIIAVLLVFSLFAKWTAYSMTDYIFKTRISNDIATAQSVRNALRTVYTEIDSNDSEWKETEQSLLHGVDITTWGTPSDSFQKEMAMVLEISDFSELKDDFYVTDGNAVVYVQLKDGDFFVQILNLNKKVEVEISAP